MFLRNWGKFVNVFKPKSLYREEIKIPTDRVIVRSTLKLRLVVFPAI